MQRQLFSPKTGEYNPNIRPITQGGTSAKTAVQAAANLGALVLGADLPNSHMTLDSNGKLPITKFSNIQLSGLSVDGELYAGRGQTVSLKISDYDFKKTYTAVCTLGIVTVTGDIISYTALNVDGDDVIELNGRKIPVKIGNPKPGKPVILTPIPGAYIYVNSCTFTSSAFVPGQTTTAETHSSSHWQVSEKSDFSSFFINSGAISDKTTWAATNLVVGKVYYVRVAYSNGSYWSSWSDPCKITVAQNVSGAVGDQTRVPGPTSGLQARLTPTYSRTSDEFGYSISLSADGNRCIVGSFRGEDSPNRADTGKAFVFTRIQTGWSQQASLSHPEIISNTSQNAQFGYSVAMSGDGLTCAVGSPQLFVSPAAGHNGSVFVYVYDPVTNMWVFEDKLSGVTTSPVSAYSGYSVALSHDGNTLAVGNPYDDNPNVVGDNGSVSIFVRQNSTWTKEQQVYPPSRVNTLHFGNAVSLSKDGNTMVVGAKNDTITTNTNGAAYIYKRTTGTWTSVAKLTNTVDYSGEVFGFSVAISGDGNTCFVGAPWKSVPNKTSYQGAVYVFVDNAGTWQQQAQIKFDDTVAKSYDYLGYSVSLTEDGNIGLIGAYGIDKSSLSESGTVYCYQRSGTSWTKLKEYKSFEPFDERLGWSCAISANGSTTAIGAPYAYASTGVVYIYV